MAISRLILQTIGASYEIISSQIIVNGYPLQMVRECTGTPMYALFAAFALAYKAPLEKKLKGAALGLLMLFILNIIRLTVIFTAAIHLSSALDFIHDFLWPSTFFIFTIIAAAYYIRWCS